MWQRVQTLYLAVATALLAVMFWHVQDTWWLILLGASTAMNLIALMAYKFRIFQMRTAVIAALLLVGLQIWMGVGFFLAKDRSGFDITTVFPAVAAILDYLAARSILSDEMLVQSASHLRSARKRNTKKQK